MVDVTATGKAVAGHAVDHRHAARVLPVGDVEGMANRAIEILSTPDLQRRLGRNGRDLAEGKFNVHAVVPKYREFYEKMIG